MKLNKGISKFTILFLLIILTSSCISVPAPESRDDTLLIVLTEKHVQGGVQIFYYYELLTDKSDTKILVTPKKKYCITAGLPPGEYEDITLTLKRYDVAGYSMSARTFPPFVRKIPFVLKSGYITIFPVKFIYKVEVSPDNTTHSSYKYENVTIKDKIQALIELSDKKGFSEWKTDYGL